MIVQDFSREMVRDYLDRENYVYLTDRDGDFVIEFSEGYRLLLMVSGEDEDILTSVMSNGRTLPPSSWAKAMHLCNRWNTEWRWPKAYLTYDEARQQGEIRLESSLWAQAGAHQAFVDHFLAYSIGLAAHCFEWLDEQGAR